MERKLNIWIVDDDPIFQMIFKMMIERVNALIAVGQFKNGQEAIDAVKNIGKDEDRIPDYIFLDINMPIKTGWDFLNELPAIVDPSFIARTKVYIVSSSINPEDEEKARTYSLTEDFLIKPLSESLIESIAKA
jgi:CheY-like chemotaxis protein